MSLDEERWPVSRDDWLVGGDRRTIAAERIYEAATALITRDGLEALDIDTLATRVHCSRATIYRHAGGKAEIRDAVLIRAAARIIESVRATVEDLSGQERLVNAITLALRRVRSDPLGQLMINNSTPGAGEMAWLTASPWVADFATDLTGLTDHDPQAAQWVVRVVLSLLYWPVEDSDTECQMVQRFVAPAFAQQT
jgi:AcrR family transcriptional regulator